LPRIKIDSSKIDGSKPINGLTPENRKHTKSNKGEVYIKK